MLDSPVAVTFLSSLVVVVCGLPEHVARCIAEGSHLERDACRRPMYLWFLGRYTACFRRLVRRNDACGSLSSGFSGLSDPNAFPILPKAEKAPLCLNLVHTQLCRTYIHFVGCSPTAAHPCIDLAHTVTSTLAPRTTHGQVKSIRYRSNTV